MANRFPITVNTSTNRLEELPANDNIDLSNSGIYDGTSTGRAGQVLTTTGSGVSWDDAPYLSSIGSIDNHTDVTISNPTNGQILKFNGTSWVNGVDDTGTTINAINDIGDVTITSPSTGQVLKFNGTSWVNGTDNEGSGSGSTTISGLTDVSISSLSVGQVLKYNGTSWVNDTDNSGGSVSLSGLSDVSVASVNNGQLLKYNSSTSKWENWSPNYLSTYTETDTLATVTERGASTNKEVTFQNVNISGTLNVTGTTATTNTTTLNVTNTKIVLNSGQQAAALSAFLEVDRGTNNADVSIKWNEVDDKWQFTNDGTTFYDIPSGAEFLTSTGSINTHTDVTITSPQSGQVLKYNGTAWVNDTDQTGSGDGSTVFVQETDPTDPVIGNLWWKPTIDSLKIYEDIDTWTTIETGGIKFIQDTTPEVQDSTEGDLWFDFSMPGIFVYTKVDQESQTPTYVWVQV